MRFGQEHQWAPGNIHVDEAFGCVAHGDAPNALAVLDLLVAMLCRIANPRRCAGWPHRSQRCGSGDGVEAETELDADTATETESEADAELDAETATDAETALDADARCVAVACLVLLAAREDLEADPAHNGAGEVADDGHDESPGGWGVDYGVAAIDGA